MQVPASATSIADVEASVGAEADKPPQAAAKKSAVVRVAFRVIMSTSLLGIDE
jgi:hypothetical protein